jgi:hypothetical protein
MINLKNDMVKKHPETGRLKKNPAILALKKSGRYNERIRISFLHSNCSFGCLLTKKIGLTQFEAIELQLWVTNRDWVKTDPRGQ